MEYNGDMFDECRESIMDNGMFDECRECLINGECLMNVERIMENV